MMAPEIVNNKDTKIKPDIKSKIVGQNTGANKEQSDNKNIGNVIIKDTSVSTTQDLYNTIYSDQIVQIYNLCIGFLISTLLLRLIEINVLSHFVNDFFLHNVVLCMLIFFITTIGGTMFTYAKITNDKKDFLKNFYQNAQE